MPYRSIFSIRQSGRRNLIGAPMKVSELNLLLCLHLKVLLYGNVVEWSMALVLKTSDSKGSVSSNLTVSSKLESGQDGNAADC